MGTGAVSRSAGPDADAAAVIAELYQRDGSARAFGIELVEGGSGRAVVSMVVRPDMCNGYDVCHGGMTFLLADTAMALASGGRTQGALAAAASIDYVHPVVLGATLVATADERWTNGRTGLYDVHVTLADGTLVAVFHGRTVRAAGPVLRSAGVQAEPPDLDPTDLDPTDLDATDLDTRGGA